MIHIRRSLFFTLVITGAMLFQVRAHAQEKVLSLDTILSKIDQNNRLLKSYEYKAERYVHQGEAATSWMAPMIGIGTYMTPYPGATTMSAAEKGSLMVQFEQAIPGRAKLQARKRAIQSLGEVEKVGRAITLNDLKAQAKLLYINGVSAGKKVKLLEESGRIMAMMKQIEELRYTHHRGSLGSIYKIEGKLLQNGNQLQELQGTILRIQSVLNSLMDLPQENHFEMDSAYLLTIDLYADLDTTALANRRADIARMNKSIVAMELDRKAIALQNRPELSVRFDHMSPLAKGGMPNSYSVMGMISIPIAPWSSKGYREESKVIHYDILALENEKSAKLQQVQGTLLGLQYEVQSMKEQLQRSQEKILPVLKKAFDAYFVNYQENTLELPQVMDAWDAVLTMRMDVLDQNQKLQELIIEYEKEIYR